MPCAASGESSRNGAPLSSRRSTRSRGSSLPRARVPRAGLLAAAQPHPLELLAQIGGQRLVIGRVGPELVRRHAASTFATTSSRPTLSPDRDAQLGHGAVHGRGQRQLHLHRLEHDHRLARLDRVAHRPRARAAPTRASAPAARRRRARGARPRPSPRSRATPSPRSRATRPRGLNGGPSPRQVGRGAMSKRLAAVDGELPVGRGAHAAEAPAVAAGERVVVGALAERAGRRRRARPARRSAAARPGRGGRSGRCPSPPRARRRGASSERRKPTLVVRPRIAVSGQRAVQAGERGRAVRAVGDHLGDHRVVVRADHASRSRPRRPRARRPGTRPAAPGRPTGRTARPRR